MLLSVSLLHLLITTLLRGVLILLLLVSALLVAAATTTFAARLLLTLLLLAGTVCKLDVQSAGHRGDGVILQGFDGVESIGLRGVGYERRAAALAGLLVLHEMRVDDFTVHLEELVQLLLGEFERQTT